MTLEHGRESIYNNHDDALPDGGHAVLDEELGLRTHAEQDIVVVIPALHQLDPLPDRTRPREFKRSALHGEHLARRDLRLIDRREVVRTGEGQHVVQDGSARMAREVEVRMLRNVH